MWNSRTLYEVDPEGKKFKSSKDVERKLEADGILHQFVNKKSSEVASEVSSTRKDCREDSDKDYQPHTEKKKKQLLKVTSNLGKYFVQSLLVMFCFAFHKFKISK